LAACATALCSPPIDHERRERLISSSAVTAPRVCESPRAGHVLWTDDMILADLAKTEFGVRRVWTEAALQAARPSGQSRSCGIATASTKLAGWVTRSPAQASNPDARGSLRCGIGSVPAQQGSDQFAADSMSVSDAVRLAPS